MREGGTRERASEGERERERQGGRERELGREGGREREREREEGERGGREGRRERGRAARWRRGFDVDAMSAAGVDGDNTIDVYDYSIDVYLLRYDFCY